MHVCRPLVPQSLLYLVSRPVSICVIPTINLLSFLVETQLFRLTLLHTRRGEHCYFRTSGTEKAVDSLVDNLSPGDTKCCDDNFSKPLIHFYLTSAFYSRRSESLNLGYYMVTHTETHTQSTQNHTHAYTYTHIHTHTNS